MKQCISNDNVAIYSIYTMLHANDLACNAIRDIEPYVNNKDKETRKIYSAIKKRVNAFFKYTYKILGHESFFISDYNEKLDEINDKDMVNLEKGIKYILQRNKIEDDGLILKTILALTLTEYATCQIRALCDKMKEENINSGELHTWELKEVHRIMASFYKWVCRKIPQTVKNEISYLANPFVTNIGINIGGYDSFVMAYEYALKEKQKYNGYTDNK